MTPGSPEGFNIGLPLNPKGDVNIGLPIEPSTNIALPVEPSEREKLFTNLANKTYDLQQKLSQGELLLRDFSSSAGKARSQIAISFGGTKNEPGAVLGYGTSQLDSDFRSAFDAIANSQNKGRLAEFVNSVKNETGWDSNTQQAFWNYVDARTANAEEYALALGKTQNVKYLPAQELRKLLKFSSDKGGGNA